LSNASGRIDPPLHWREQFARRKKRINTMNGFPPAVTQM
jgi:hypothetical protein